MRRVGELIMGKLHWLSNWVSEHQLEYYLICCAICAFPILHMSFAFKEHFIRGFFLVIFGIFVFGYFLSLLLPLVYGIVLMLINIVIHPMQSLLILLKLLKYILYIAIGLGVFYILDKITGGALGAVVHYLTILLGE